MPEPRQAADEYDIKQCGRCAAWIPRTATMCAACGTSSPDVRIDPRPRRNPVGLPLGVTMTRILVAANLAWFVVSCLVQSADPATRPGSFLVEGSTGHGGAPIGLWAPGWYQHALVFTHGQWWRVLDATFLHGGIVHLALNMFALYRLGHLAEEVFGGAKLLALYVLFAACSTLAGSVWSVGLRGAADSHPVVGASGAICGIAGLLTSFLLVRGSDRGRAIGMQVGQNLLLVLLIGAFIPWVSDTGHIGGAVPGLLVGLVVRQSWSTRLSPASRRNWWLAAALAGVTTVVALGSGALFAVRYLREHT